MNSFVLIGRTFFYQTLEILREIKLQEPNSKCTILVSARGDTLSLLNSYNDLVDYARIDWLSDNESKWLTTPLDQSKLSYYENIFGIQRLRAIITADRELGIGFVSGGVYAESKLLKLARDNDDARWRYVVGLLDYLYESFKRDKPDFVFVYCIASSVTYAMYLVAKSLGITFIQPVSTRIDNTYVIDDNSNQDLTLVKKTFEGASKTPELVKEYLPHAESYIEKIRNNHEIPEYINRMKLESIKQSTFLGMIRTFCIDMARWCIIMLGLKGTRGVLRQRKGWAIILENLNVFIETRRALKGKIFEEIDVKSAGKYIYFPLHVDPEASTMVLADQLTDQLFIIETIAKNMPTDTKLFVKEHIPSIGRRPKFYYERIRNMPDVKLISPFMSSAQLIKHSSLVFTITGTAAWEAMVIGKPAIVMGNAHYKGIGDGFISCPNISDIGNAIQSAINLPIIDDYKLKLFIASIFKESVYFPESVWCDSSIAGDREVSKKVITKIRECINTIGS